MLHYGLVAFAILIFVNDMSTRIWTVIGCVILAFISTFVSNWRGKRLKAKREKELTPKEIVNREIDKHYAEFKKLNPSDFFPPATTEAESRSIHRAWWKKEYNFEIEGFE